MGKFFRLKKDATDHEIDLQLPHIVIDSGVHVKASLIFEWKQTLNELESSH
jgi:hypothetical protein